MPSKEVLEKKKQIVQELVESLSAAKSMIFVDYRGLTVEQDTELRSALRKSGVKYKVVKNTLTRIAVDQMGLQGLNPYLEGPTSVAFSDTDPVAPAKIMNQYAGKFDKLQLKVGVVEGRIVDVEGIKALANLPSREVLVSQVLGGLNAPLYGLVNVLNGNIRGLAIALNEIAKKKEAASA